MLTIDFREIEQAARDIGGAIDQVPFALSKAMNDAAKATRTTLIEDTWPKHVTVRNKRFLGAALRTEFASKRNLRIAIYDNLGRGHLAAHDQGGTKQAKKRLAIPPKGSVTRTPRGVSKSQTPRAIITRTPKRALRITPKGIFVGEGGRLKLKYLFKPSARQPADVPFTHDFNIAFARELTRLFPAAMASAMKSRRVR